MTTTYRRAPAFDSLTALLDWSERHGAQTTSVERVPDGTWRGSVETSDGDETPGSEET